MFDLGEASAFFDEADPEVAQKLNDMRAGLGSHLQSGFAKFVQEHKEQWEAARKDIMQIVEENKAKKRKADNETEPKTPERTSPATSTTPNDVAPECRAVPPISVVGGAPPPEPTTQATALPTNAAPTAAGKLRFLAKKQGLLRSKPRPRLESSCFEKRHWLGQLLRSHRPKLKPLQSRSSTAAWIAPR